MGGLTSVVDDQKAADSNDSFIQGSSHCFWTNIDARRRLVNNREKENLASTV